MCRGGTKHILFPDITIAEFLVTSFLATSETPQQRSYSLRIEGTTQSRSSVEAALTIYKRRCRRSCILAPFIPVCLAHEPKVGLVEVLKIWKRGCEF